MTDPVASVIAADKAAAVEAAVEIASAIGYAQMRHDPAVWHEALDHALPDMIAAVWPLIARATADAIADKIRERRLPYITEEAGRDWYQRGIAYGMDSAANIARAHGRTPETETTEDGQ